MEGEGKPKAEPLTCARRGRGPTPTTSSRRLPDSDATLETERATLGLNEGEGVDLTDA